jgi:UDP-N-acetylmuramoyl-tripeptide--D-alanyl-D-alanine ligase
MKRLPLQTIVKAIDGQIEQGPDALTIRYVVTGTKRIKEGTLFFSVYRQRRSPAICDKNQPFAIVTDRTEDFSGLGRYTTLISVPRIKDAYYQFVDFYRGLFDIPVIGVTGTCGKTTTKEMIKHILSGAYRVSATYKSQNALFRNLGYLLDIDDHTQAAVYEMGVAYPGDLKKSCRYFKPRVGVITNIGIDHLYGCKSLEAYIKAKAELLEGMGFDGTLVINADDSNIRRIDLQAFQGKIVTFGMRRQADYQVAGIVHKSGKLGFNLRHQGRSYSLALPGHADFNVYNAAAAIAASHAVGVPIEEAAARLGSFQNVEKHFEFHKGINGSTVIDDTWSTNPTSIEAALQLLKSLAGGRKTTAVLGKMSLLGDEHEKYHYMTGKKVANLGIDQLIALGPGAEGIRDGAIQSGMRRDCVFFCRDAAETYEILKRTLNKHSIVLIKTSMLASYGELINKLIMKR